MGDGAEKPGSDRRQTVTIVNVYEILKAYYSAGGTELTDKDYLIRRGQSIFVSPDGEHIQLMLELDLVNSDETPRPASIVANPVKDSLESIVVASIGEDHREELTTHPVIVTEDSQQKAPRIDYLPGEQKIIGLEKNGMVKFDLDATRMVSKIGTIGVPSKALIQYLGADYKVPEKGHLRIDDFLLLLKAANPHSPMALIPKDTYNLLKTDFAEASSEFFMNFDDTPTELSISVFKGAVNTFRNFPSSHKRSNASFEFYSKASPIIRVISDGVGIPYEPVVKKSEPVIVKARQYEINDLEGIAKAAGRIESLMNFDSFSSEIISHKSAGNYTLHLPKKLVKRAHKVKGVKGFGIMIENFYILKSNDTNSFLLVPDHNYNELISNADIKAFLESKYTKYENPIKPGHGGMIENPYRVKPHQKGMLKGYGPLIEISFPEDVGIAIEYHKKSRGENRETGPNSNPLEIKLDINEGPELKSFMPEEERRPENAIVQRDPVLDYASKLTVDNFCNVLLGKTDNLLFFSVDKVVETFYNKISVRIDLPEQMTDNKYITRGESKFNGNINSYTVFWSPIIEDGSFPDMIFVEGSVNHKEMHKHQETRNLFFQQYNYSIVGARLSGDLTSLLTLPPDRAGCLKGKKIHLIADNSPIVRAYIK